MFLMNTRQGYLYCNQPGFSEELLVVFGDSQNATLVIPIGYKDYEYEDPYALMPNIHTQINESFIFWQ